MVVIVLYVFEFPAVVIFLTNEADKVYMCLFRVKKTTFKNVRKFYAMYIRKTIQ